jgi:hypothetical protein
MKGAVVAAVFGLVQWAAAVPSSCKGATVDLGYGKYRGYHSKEYGLDIWKRYVRCLIGDDVACLLCFALFCLMRSWLEASYHNITSHHIILPTAKIPLANSLGTAASPMQPLPSVTCAGRLLNQCNHPAMESSPLSSSRLCVPSLVPMACQQSTASTLDLEMRTVYTSTSMPPQMPRACPYWSGSVCCLPSPPMVRHD